MAEIQELSNDWWNHVESSQNPGDLVSLGATASELRNCDLWWNSHSGLFKMNVVGRHREK